MFGKKILLMMVFAVLFGGAMAQDADYVGAMKCKMCHNKPAIGEQYKKWLEGPHANALKSLSSEKALAYAKEHGIADPAKEESCLKCHSTYAQIDQDHNIGVKPTEGVSCESCHGAGSKYKTNSIMKNREKAIAAGLIIPDAKTCEGCHNEDNPFHKPFNYDEYYKKIAHEIPE
ncbi:MAG: cytochrome c family protein [Bacteroidales bacterium]